MTSENRLIQYLLSKKAKTRSGFTLIELLVVIVILGVLAAIALPSFLNQANRARESEATTYVGSMNRAQQVYYLEQQQFATNDDFQSGALALGIDPETTNYNYVVAGGGEGNVGVSNQAQPALGENAPVRAFVGFTAVRSLPVTNELTTLAILCRGIVTPISGGPTGADPGVGGGAEELQCPTEDYEEIS